MIIFLFNPSLAHKQPQLQHQAKLLQETIQKTVDETLTQKDPAFLFLTSAIQNISQQNDRLRWPKKEMTSNKKCPGLEREKNTAYRLNFFSNFKKNFVKKSKKILLDRICNEKNNRDPISVHQVDGRLCELEPLKNLAISYCLNYGDQTKQDFKKSFCFKGIQNQRNLKMSQTLWEAELRSSNEQTLANLEKALDQKIVKMIID